MTLFISAVMYEGGGGVRQLTSTSFKRLIIDHQRSLLAHLRHVKKLLMNIN